MVVSIWISMSKGKNAYRRLRTLEKRTTIGATLPGSTGNKNAAPTRLV